MARGSGRKRRRRQEGSADGGKLKPSLPTESLPHVVITAPTPCPSKSHRHTSTSERPNTTTTQAPQPLTDDSELQAQIWTLSLIKTYGYGPIPGTPCLPGSKLASSLAGGRLPRNSRTADGAPASDGDRRRGRRGMFRHQSASLRPNTEPWIGAMDSGVGVPHESKRAAEGDKSHRGLFIRKLRSEPGVTIEREEFKSTKARREATTRGRYLRSQLDRVLQRRDLIAAAELIKSARAEFLSAEDNDGTAEVDATLVKIKADMVVEAMDIARKARDYDRVQDLMFEALHYFAILASIVQVQRHDAHCFSERRDAERKAYEGFRHPRRRCREYALEDGRALRDAAAALVLKRKYPEARERLKAARACFNWAGGADAEVRELQRVLEEVEVRENANYGDHLIEGVANKLQLFTKKDYKSLFSELSEAATAFEVARDREGAQVVRLVTTGLRSIRSAEQSWLDLVQALKERRYPIAARHLRDATRYVGNATRGLPFVSPSLARSTKVLFPAGGLGSLDIIAELAALEGLRDHIKSLQALEQGLLDKALQLNTSAREVFEFTMRCARAHSRSTSGSAVSGSSVGGSAGGSIDSAQSKEDGKRRGSDRTEASSSVIESKRAFAARTTDQTALDGINSPPFAPSAEELHEGEALLFSIRRATSAPTLADSGAIPTATSAPGHPGVRHRVEDLLDEVSETEDRIVRNKALERGDRLMSLFLKTVGGRPAVGIGVDKGIIGPVNNIVLGYGTSGDALPPETENECLQLLAEAHEAYEGQGFERQAEYATRLRLGILADRCLAEAPKLLHAAGATEFDTGPTRSASGASPTNDNVDEETLKIGDDDHARGTSGRDFEAARAAAREAENNYGRAGNGEGALRARRTELSLRGDEAMVAVGPLLDNMDYDAALVNLGRARRFYTEAGPQGVVGLSRTQDPEVVVQTAAIRDGRRLKSEALRALRNGEVEVSIKHYRQAQRSFTFVDQEGLADATADVEGAVCMVTRLAAGDAIVVEAEAALENGQGSRATDLLRQAKSLYHEAQLSYESLVDQVTCLLEEQPVDLEAVQKAMELQDNINSLYNSRRDGQRSVQVESRLDCLAADASLEQLDQVIDHEQFEDARALLSGAVLIYERAQDESRLTKASRILSLITLVARANTAIRECRYADAEMLIGEGMTERASLVTERPFTLQPPNCMLFRGEGEAGARSVVLSRAHAAGNIDRLTALSLLNEGQFDAAAAAAASSAGRLVWCASQSGSGAGNDDGGAAKMQTVEDLTKTVAVASVEAQAQRSLEEALTLKEAKDFSGAVKAAMAAARLFDAAGLSARAVAARAEADQTEGEALVLESEKLLEEGKLEAIVERLDRAEKLFLVAIRPTSNAPVSSEDGDGVAGMNGREDNVFEARGPQQYLNDLHQLRSRVNGDLVTRGVGPALDTHDYDLALRLMLEANDHYAKTKTELKGKGETGQWVASATMSNSKDTTVMSPNEAVTKRAAQDGERLRVDAAIAIHKEKNPVKARGLLSTAEACMVWAGVDHVAGGAKAVAKDINAFESRVAGDEICRSLIHLLLNGDFQEANAMLEDALDIYRQGDAFKQITDTRAVMFCVEREERLCSDVVAAVAGNDPAAALKILEQSRPVFEMAAEMASVVLHDVAQLMEVKRKHIVALSAVCRAWLQCVGSRVVPARENGDVSPTLAEEMHKELSNLRAMTSAGATALDIPVGLFEQARATVAMSLKTSEEHLAILDDARDALDAHTGSNVDESGLGVLGYPPQKTPREASDATEKRGRSMGHSSDLLAGDQNHECTNTTDVAAEEDLVAQGDGARRMGDTLHGNDNDKSGETRFDADSESSLSLSLGDDSDTELEHKVDPDEERALCQVEGNAGTTEVPPSVVASRCAADVIEIDFNGDCGVVDAEVHSLVSTVQAPASRSAMAGAGSLEDGYGDKHPQSHSAEVEVDIDEAVDAVDCKPGIPIQSDEAANPIFPSFDRFTSSADTLETSAGKSTLHPHGVDGNENGDVAVSRLMEETGDAGYPSSLASSRETATSGVEHLECHRDHRHLNIHTGVGGENTDREAATLESLRENMARAGHTRNASLPSGEPCVGPACDAANIWSRYDGDSQSRGIKVCRADTEKSAEGDISPIVRGETTGVSIDEAVPVPAVVEDQGAVRHPFGINGNARSPAKTPSDKSDVLRYGLDDDSASTQAHVEASIRGGYRDSGETDGDFLETNSASDSGRNDQRGQAQNAEDTLTDVVNHDGQRKADVQSSRRSPTSSEGCCNASVAHKGTERNSSLATGGISAPDTTVPQTESAPNKAHVHDGLAADVAKYCDGGDNSSTIGSSSAATNRSSDQSYAEDSTTFASDSAGGLSQSETYSETYDSAETSFSETEQEGEIPSAASIDAAWSPVSVDNGAKTSVDDRHDETVDISDSSMTSSRLTLAQATRNAPERQVDDEIDALASAASHQYTGLPAAAAAAVESSQLPREHEPMTALELETDRDDSSSLSPSIADGTGKVDVGGFGIDVVAFPKRKSTIPVTHPEHGSSGIVDIECHNEAHIYEEKEEQTREMTDSYIVQDEQRDLGNRDGKRRGSGSDVPNGVAACEDSVLGQVPVSSVVASTTPKQLDIGDLGESNLMALPQQEHLDIVDDAVVNDADGPVESVPTEAFAAIPDQTEDGTLGESLYRSNLAATDTEENVMDMHGCFSEMLSASSGSPGTRNTASPPSAPLPIYATFAPNACTTEIQPERFATQPLEKHVHNESDHASGYSYSQDGQAEQLCTADSSEVVDTGHVVPLDRSYMNICGNRPSTADTERELKFSSAHFGTTSETVAGDKGDRASHERDSFEVFIHHDTRGDGAAASVAPGFVSVHGPTPVANASNSSAASNEWDDGSSAAGVVVTEENHHAAQHGSLLDSSIVNGADINTAPTSMESGFVSVDTPGPNVFDRLPRVTHMADSSPLEPYSARAFEELVDDQDSAQEGHQMGASIDRGSEMEPETAPVERRPDMPVDSPTSEAKNPHQPAAAKQGVKASAPLQAPVEVGINHDDTPGWGLDSTLDSERDYNPENLRIGYGSALTTGTPALEALGSNAEGLAIASPDPGYTNSGVGEGEGGCGGSEKESHFFPLMDGQDQATDSCAPVEPGHVVQPTDDSGQESEDVGQTRPTSMADEVASSSHLRASEPAVEGEIVDRENETDELGCTPVADGSPPAESSSDLLNSGCRVAAGVVEQLKAESSLVDVFTVEPTMDLTAANGDESCYAEDSDVETDASAESMGVLVGDVHQEDESDDLYNIEDGQDLSSDEA